MLYRQVNHRYRADYDRLIGSGLLAALNDHGFLVTHAEVDSDGLTTDAYKVLRPERIPFISYPFEWSFGQLRDAALATLDAQALSLSHGMSLKDASAYNVQFLGGKPILIDTLSFETYHEGQPWAAYRQFCQHFLAPLSLMARRDVRLSQLFRVFIDGVPLDLASALLPKRSWLRPSTTMHVHLHALAQRRYSHASASKPLRQPRVSRQSLVALIGSLRAAVTGLKWNPEGTEWSDYYQFTNYTEPSAAEKQRLVAAAIDRILPSSVWDFGANTGRFSRLASDRGILTVAFDMDAAAVEKNYRGCVAAANRHMLPLVLDLTNPTSGIGWAGDERQSLQARGPADLIFALALIHHLAIGNNVPLARIAEFLARVGRWALVEFVPKSDSQVQRMLASRVDIFDQYSREAFEEAFSRYFAIESADPISGSERILYLLRNRTIPS